MSNDAKPTEQMTVRVRILVAVDAKGQWVGYGWWKAKDAEEIKDAMVLDGGLDQGEVYHWIEADVPLPAEAGPAIEGVVHADK